MCFSPTHAVQNSMVLAVHEPWIWIGQTNLAQRSSCFLAKLFFMLSVRLRLILIWIVLDHFQHLVLFSASLLQNPKLRKTPNSYRYIIDINVAGFSYCFEIELYKRGLNKTAKILIFLEISFKFCLKIIFGHFLFKSFQIINNWTRTLWISKSCSFLVFDGTLRRSEKR